MFPPIPTWEGLHPIIVHFPIALLMIAPVIIILGLLMPKNGRAVLISAFVLMLIGTIATFVAVSTGDAAGELAETTQTVFAALTTIFGVMLFAPMIFKKELSRKIVIPLNVAFLVFYGAGVVLLMNTAHQGGRLVHEFGVTANNPQSTQTTPGAVEKRSKKDDHDD